MPPDVLSITIRNLGYDGLPPWERTVYSWRRAWRIVDEAVWPRRRTHVYKLGTPEGMRPSREYGEWSVDFKE